MPSPVTFNVAIAPLPVPWTGTPQELVTDIASRLTVTPAEEWNSFQVSDSIPESDIGPVLYEGVEWRVFDTDLSGYTYLRTNGEAIVESTVPLAAAATEAENANRVYTWDDDGKPAALETGADGTVLSSVDGTPTWVSASNYPARIDLAGSSLLAITGNPEKVTNFSAVAFDPDSRYDGVNTRYVAPVDGIYQWSTKLQVDNVSGDAANMEMNIRGLKNGAYEIISGGVSIANPPGARWYPAFSGLVQLSAGDYVEVYLYCADTVLSGNVSIANGFQSIHLVQAI